MQKLETTWTKCKKNVWLVVNRVSRRTRFLLPTLFCCHKLLCHTKQATDTAGMSERGKQYCLFCVQLFRKWFRYCRLIELKRHYMLWERALNNFRNNRLKAWSAEWLLTWHADTKTMFNCSENTKTRLWSAWQCISTHIIRITLLSSLLNWSYFLKYSYRIYM